MFHFANPLNRGEKVRRAGLILLTSSSDNGTDLAVSENLVADMSCGIIAGFGSFNRINTYEEAKEACVTC